MSKIIVYITTIVTIIFFGACNNEEFLPETEVETGRTISLTASMPEESPVTRVDLDKDGKNIELTWKVNDQIQIVFAQGGVPVFAQAVYVTSTSNGGKTANFSIKLPEEITTETFDLYGVYGGNGLLPEDLTIAVLPRNPYNANSLNIGPSSVESRKDVVLYFSYKNIPVNSPQTSVKFKHLGSLFSVVIDDANSTMYDYLASQDLRQIRLTGVNNENQKWAFNSIACGQRFNMASEKFIDYDNSSNYIYYNLSSINFSDGLITVWGWYPMPGKVWPELKLELTDSSGTKSISTVNRKPAKGIAPVAGKSYYFYVTHDNATAPNRKFYFSDAAFNVLP